MNKQIEKMAKDICRRELEPNCATCYFQDKNCRDLILSKKLYNKGYHKASDIIDDVNRSLTTKVFNSNEIATGYLWAITDVRKLLLKLKKKYESEGTDDA